MPRPRCGRGDKLQAAAKTGNLDQIKAAFGALGETCKACHDKYQKEQLRPRSAQLGEAEHDPAGHALTSSRSW